MRLWPRKKPAAPREERRKPENATLRKQLDTAQKLEAQATLAEAQAQTAALNPRIDMLRGVAKVVAAGRKAQSR